MQATKLLHDVALTEVYVRGLVGMHVIPKLTGLGEKLCLSSTDSSIVHVRAYHRVHSGLFMVIFPNLNRQFELQSMSTPLRFCGLPFVGT